jgi:polysaccharide export outer membrane protein
VNPRRRSFAYRVAAVAAGVAFALPTVAMAQEPVTPPPAEAAAPQPAQEQPPLLPQGVPLPADYVIGPEDLLGVVFWRDEDMTADVVVRPDGKITLPLINDVQAAGLTPDELRGRITEAAKEYLEAPTVSVVVKEIHSRRVFITGMVNKPGAYPLTTPTTVLQLLSLAGGLQEFASSKNIMIMRTEDGDQTAMKFNYKDVRQGKNLEQNILLKPGDTVVVP